MASLLIVFFVIALVVGGIGAYVGAWEGDGQSYSSQPGPKPFDQMTRHEQAIYLQQVGMMDGPVKRAVYDPYH